MAKTKEEAAPIAPETPPASHQTPGVIRKSASIANLARALVVALGELENPPKDDYNPHFKNKFCSLAGARDWIKPVLTRHGLAMIQSLGSGERGPRVITLILHTSGEWIESEPLELPASKQDAQGYGSAATYARRYSLLAAAGVVGDDDDDAEAASKPAQQKAAKSAPEKAPMSVLEYVSQCDAKMVAEGLARAEELTNHVFEKFRSRYAGPMSGWPLEAKKDIGITILAFHEAKKKATVKA